MHSVYARFNNISATLSTCLMVLLGAIACTSLLFSADPKGDITASVKVCVQLIIVFLLLQLYITYHIATRSRVYLSVNVYSRDNRRINARAIDSETVIMSPAAVPLGCC